MTDIEHPTHLPAPEREVHLLGEVEFERPTRPRLPGDRVRLLAGIACGVGVMLGVAWLSDWMEKRGSDEERSPRSR